MKTIYSFDLDSNSSQRLSAKGTLMYTLLLPDIVPINEENRDKWIDYTIWQCISNCHPNIFTSGYYNFFGAVDKSVDKDSLFNIAVSNQSLDDCTKDNLYFLKRDFISNTIMMQCVMFAYDIIMQSLIENSVTSYTFRNKINNRGHNELIAEKVLNNNFTWSVYNYNGSDNYSSRSSGFEAKMITHKKVFDNNDFANSFYIGDTVQLTQSALFFNIIDSHSAMCNKFLSLYHTNGDPPKSLGLSKTENIITFFYNCLLEEAPSDPTDRLYYLYKFENIFGLNLAGNLNQLINKQKGSDKYLLQERNIIDILALVSRLPNSLSRNLYLQFAFEALRNRPSTPSTFFRDMQRPEVFGTFEDKVPLSTGRWLGDYKHFCTFFSEFVFPVYEWYFLLILLETVELNVKECSHKDRLIILQQLLKDYIGKNHEQFENPLIGQTDNSRSLIANYNSNKIIKTKPEEDFNKTLTLLLTSFKTVCQGTIMPCKPLGKDFCFKSMDNKEMKIMRSLYIDAILS